MNRKIIAAALLIILGMSLALPANAFAADTAYNAEENVISDTPYQYGIGSVSKTFTAIAVMRLADEGKLELDEPVVSYLPEFRMADERYRDITVRMLLNHTSGLMGSLYHNGILFEQGGSQTRDRLLEELSAQRLKAKPGSYMVYCNDGFVLAELLVERMSGICFSDFVQSRICKPLGMTHTSAPYDLEDAADKSVKHASNYINGSIRLPSEAVTEMGSGGIRSTTEDLAKLSRIFTENGAGVLSEAAVREMCSDYYASTDYLYLPELNGKTTGLGLDFVNSYAFERFNIQAIGKGGDLDFQHANLTILPKENMSAAVLSSSGSSTFNQLVAQTLLLTALEAEDRIPAGSSTENQLRAWEDEEETEMKREVCEIPERMYSFAGYYAGKHAAELSFPTNMTMRIRTLGEAPEITMELQYNTDGWFTGDERATLANEAASSADGSVGVSRAKLIEESDGKVYLYTATKGQYAGLGMYDYAEVFGQKTEAETLSPEVKSAWRERIGKKYYLSNDLYSSAEWTQSTSRRIELRDIGVAGYVYGATSMGVKRILTEDSAESACIGRDMSTVSFMRKQGVEYLSIDDGGSVYMSEDGMRELESGVSTYTVEESDAAQWFTIPKARQGERVALQISGKGMAAVYDRYDECIFSTFSLNGDGCVLLPPEGKLAFTGEKGAVLKISAE